MLRIAIVVSMALASMAPGASGDPAETYVPYRQAIVASAGWGNGAYPEPNQPEDRVGLWTSATTSMRRAYLDAHVLQEAVPPTAVPGVGTIAAVYRIFAHYGVWRDCNEDRFMGAPGALEYGSRLFVTPRTLIVNANCPIVEGEQGHNDGATIRELRWFVSEREGPADRRYVGYAWSRLGGPHDEARPSFGDVVAPIPIPGIEEAVRVLAPGAGSVLELRFRDDRPAPVRSSPMEPLLVPDPLHATGPAACAAGACLGWWSDPFIVVEPLPDGNLRTTPVGRITTYGRSIDAEAGGAGFPIAGWDPVGGSYRIRDVDDFGGVDVDAQVPCVGGGVLTDVRTGSAAQGEIAVSGQGSATSRPCFGSGLGLAIARGGDAACDGVAIVCIAVSSDRTARCGDAILCLAAGFQRVDCETASLCVGASRNGPVVGTEV